MAVTVGYQTWDSANYTWDSAVAGKPVPEMVAALSSWITAINSNPSQSGKQAAILRDASSSTTANYRGFVAKFPILESATKSLYFQHISTSSSTSYTKFYDDGGWADNTGNGGYGGSTATSASEFLAIDSHSHKNTVTTYGDILIASDTVDGQEFFFVGLYLDGDTANFSDGWGVAKDIHGNWCGLSIDGSAEMGAYYDPYFDRVRLASNLSTVTNAPGTATVFGACPPSMYASTFNAVDGETIRMGTETANPNFLWQSASPTIYAYKNLGGGQYMLNLTVNGPLVIYTQV